MPAHDQLAAESRLLHELAAEEAALVQAEDALRIARNDYDVAARKYAAVRDLVTDVLGYSPYHEDAGWLAPASQVVARERRGAYRFLLMRPRDAIVAALSEGPSELDLEGINERLKSGGLDLGLRAINAAVMRLGGVRKGPKGTFRLAESPRRTRAA
jgi:hypothetical protein